MKTAVTYSVVSRKNPRQPELPCLFYAQAQARGEADIRSLSDRIELMCTVTRADVMAVLVALESVIKECLSNGEIVRLGDLGSLQLSLSSKGAGSKKEFTTSLIDKTRILFRPGETLSAMQKTLHFERVETVQKNAEQGGEAGTKEPADSKEPTAPAGPTDSTGPKEPADPTGPKEPTAPADPKEPAVSKE